MAERVVERSYPAKRLEGIKIQDKLIEKYGQETVPQSFPSPEDQSYFDSIELLFLSPDKGHYLAKGIDGDSQTLIRDGREILGGKNLLFYPLSDDYSRLYVEDSKKDYSGKDKKYVSLVMGKTVALDQICGDNVGLVETKNIKNNQENIVIWSIEKGKVSFDTFSLPSLEYERLFQVKDKHFGSDIHCLESNENNSVIIWRAFKHDKRHIFRNDQLLMRSKESIRSYISKDCSCVVNIDPRRVVLNGETIYKGRTKGAEPCFDEYFKIGVVEVEDKWEPQKSKLLVLKNPIDDELERFFLTGQRFNKVESLEAEHHKVRAVVYDEKGVKREIVFE